MENKLKGAVLAIDYGAKRTGLAITDPLQIIASPLETVPTKELMTRIEQLFFTEKVVELVVGEALRASGEPSEIESEIQGFLGKFRKKYPAIQVHRQDESYTSKMAAQALIKGGMPKKKRQVKGALDKVSAALILQAYLQQKP